MSKSFRMSNFKSGGKPVIMSITTLVKKVSMAAAGIALIALGTSKPAQAGSLTTTFAGGNGFAGNMFDVTTFGNALNVTSLEINSYLGSLSSPKTLDVYIKSGSFVGFETNAAAWTKVSSTILNSVSPVGTPTFVDITDFILSANSLTGFYITFADGNPGIEYTNGSNTYSNADLKIQTGVGKGGVFGATFSPRTWNGTINYTIASVPEPASVLGLLAVGALGAGSNLKRKLQAKSATLN